MTSTYFNAHHSPVGAFATLTLGMKGPNGGFGLELAGPACEGVYVGLETREGGQFQTFPWYGQPEVAAEDYDVEGLSDFQYAQATGNFPDDQITRNLGASIDEWTAPDITFRIYSPPKPIPNPETEDAKDALTPALIVELTIDNRGNGQERRAFLGYAGSDRYAGMRILQTPGLTGVGQGSTVAIATEDPNTYAGLGWQPEAILSPKIKENLGFMLGSIGLIVATVPPNELKTFRFAAAFFREGAATTGIKTRYLYRRWFNQVEEVLTHALTTADATIKQAQKFDQVIKTNLSSERALMLAHAIRSYYGSTQLLETEDGKPLWVVHEGEYRMMNTFDLTVDQTFFELVMNPWTVKNVLDQFVDNYSYTEDTRFPNSPQRHPGGIAFTHDMGVANNFAPKGHSGYEQAGLTGCFSFMSTEELMNWVLTAGLYVADTQDQAWSDKNKETWLACLQSLENRDHPQDDKRNGVMGLDDARCQGGAEITTYDSLDASLGQARNNLYLAVKGWAAYLLLNQALTNLNEPEAAQRALTQAKRAAATVVASKNEEGLLPAIVEEEKTKARIIPAIEALVYPHVTGIANDFPELKQTLLTHLQAVLKPGVCKFPDGGWRLSSTSRNSWLSKIYLCQYVAEQILGQEEDAEADRAHLAWLMREDNVFYAWSDQMLEGKAVGSRYYPRGVTAILWLATQAEPLKQIRYLTS